MIAHADEIQQNTNVVTKKSDDLSFEIQNSVRVTQQYDNSVKVSIVDTPKLRKVLNENNVSYTELTNMVDQINQYFEKNKRDISSSLNYLYVSKAKSSKHKHKKKKNNSGTCSKALQFIGYVHSGAYAAAAAMLGVTGPASVIVPLVIGLIYQAGSLFC